MIKHLVEDGRYDYIETGSLISIRKNVEKIQIPSEERHMELRPLTFEEFMWAQGNEVSLEIVKDCFDSGYISREAHSRMMAEFRKYMVIGGMPQVVDAYLRTHNIMDVDDIKNDILDLYRSDMENIPRLLGANALNLFNTVPSMLSSHGKVFSPNKVKTGARLRTYESSTTWVREAKLINQCYKLNDPSVAYSLSIDPSRYKNYFLDTGLLISLAFGKNREKLSDTYSALINGKLNINEGMFFENIIAQELVALGYELRFSEFYHKDSKELQEVDFIIPGIEKMIPLESKSVSSSKHISLDRFMDKYRNRVEKAYVIHSKELRSEGNITYLPAYMVMFL